MKTTLAKTAGYCFGVKRAVNLAIETGKTRGNVYTLGPIIHNSHVIKKLEESNVRLAETIDDIPDSACVIIRTHGIPKKLYEILEGKGCTYIDATCPFVSKIHDTVKKESESGRQVIIIGAKNHPEVIGIEGWCSTKAHVFESPQDVENWIDKTPDLQEVPVSVVAQTTINKEMWNECINLIKKACTNAKVFDTICNATIERQNEVQLLANQVDAMIVIGDRNSSNTKRLFEISQSLCPKVAHIENAAELDDSFLRGANHVGITAGASTPEWIIKEVVNKMSDETRIESTESFEELLEKSLKTLNTGDKVTGIITQIAPTEINVDLGVKQAGYIPVTELSDDPSYKVEEHLAVGQEIEAFVMRVNDVEGVIMLSKKRLDTVKGWEKIEQAREEKTPLKGVVLEENKGGVIASVLGVRVFIPASQTGLPKDAPMDSIMKKEITLYITEVNRARRRVVGSIRAYEMDQRREAAQAIWDTIEIGAKYKGVVKSLTNFGAFVDIGGIDGMVHISELSWGRIGHPSEVLNVGDTVEVYVISFDKEKRKISLGYKTAESNPWTIFEGKYNVGDIIDVKIVRFMPFGAFAEIIPGVDGLIHISQIADRHIAKPDDVLKIGETVKVKILAIDMEKKKVSISIRALLEPEAPAEEILSAEKAAGEEAGVAAEAPAEEEAPAAESSKEETEAEKAPEEETAASESQE